MSLQIYLVLNSTLWSAEAFGINSQSEARSDLFVIDSPLSNQVLYLHISTSEQRLLSYVDGIFFVGMGKKSRDGIMSSRGVEPWLPIRPVRHKLSCGISEWVYSSQAWEKVRAIVKCLPRESNAVSPFTSSSTKRMGIFFAGAGKNSGR
ncbi:hypothetical protein B0H10DRAFT_776064 [Mycena sp. CBHHK59/15]|nr:hypothetical protein B0H10DRAFT_776064 [Mycena sp. CBHHK59/15]